ncbi:MAG: hypothetical protein J6W24_02725 [Prevotella sp.]|nr:hypothetical protein [Prevotella sp.]
MDNVIAYLERSDYFTTHCHHHHHYEGGLADHSLGVYWEMRASAPELPDESCRIVALLHDLCTTHLEEYDDIGHHRHGLRSVRLLEALGLTLSNEEHLAISKHMHHVPSAERGLLSTALWYWLHHCDRRNAKTA